MEVKVFCPCGSKYKFDVEPVNERMPWPVNCPSCGADGTALANEVIAQTLAANPAAATPVPAPAPVPIQMAAAAPAPAPAPAPSGLRINKPEHAPAAPPPVGAPPPLSGRPGGFTPASTRPLASVRPPSTGEPMWKKIAGGTFGAIVIGLIAFKWIYRIARVSHAISAGSDLPNTAELAATLSEMKELNLMADDGVVLYVKHDNHRDIAQECQTFWKEKDHQDFKIIAPQKEEISDKEYAVYAAHNGYVRILSGLKWKDPSFEATAQHLSEKYNTMVFDEKDVGSSGAFVFGVYDSGSNVFHMKMTVNRNGDEKIKIDHVEWAEAHGYKPSNHGNKDFDIVDANRLTKTFGMKFWDEKDETPTNYVVLASAGK